MGTCQKTDSCTQDKCEAWCGDFKTDKDHCGNCETQCKAGEYCNGGTCASIDSCTQDKCDGWCGDFQNAPKHCGNCQTDCTIYEGVTGTCSEGKCVFTSALCKDETDSSGNITHHKKICFKDGNPSCTDIDNDPNNCGECGEKCEINETCFNGNCQSKLACSADNIECGFKEDASGVRIPNCFDPTEKDYCGAECIVISHEDIDTYQCPDGYKCLKVESSAKDNTDNYILKIIDCPSLSVCTKDSTSNYSCSCEYPATGPNAKDGFCIDSYIENEITINRRRCLDPTSSSTCGESDCSRNGNNCNASHTSCVENSEGKYGCDCLSWELACKSENGEIKCINPASDNEHCGITSCEALSDNSHNCSTYGDAICENGKCVCKNNLSLCDGKCIDPLTTYEHCGEVNTCGINCRDFEQDNSTLKECVAGKCICKHPESSITYSLENGNTLCLYGSEDEYCGIHKEGSDYLFDDCTKIGAICNDGHCSCVGGRVMCDGKCIDPASNPNYCGAIHNANTSCGYWEKCEGDTPVCVSGKCTSSCPNGQIVCEGVCVNQDDYHLTNDCMKCNHEVCYTGEMDDNGNPINFDYRLCKTDDNSNLNIQNNNNFCGGCTDRKPEKCVNGFSCLMNYSSGQYACSCPTDKLKINRYQDTSNADNPELCLTFGTLHIEKCDSCEKGYQCSNGFADCNNDMSDGCEVNLKTDIMNCGHCAANCNDYAIHAYGAKCISGVCSYTCHENYGNCNNDIKDGCETTDLNSDINHCGRCNTVCEGKGCNHGLCCWNHNMVSSKILTKADCCDANANVYREYENYWPSIKVDSDFWQCSTTAPEGNWKLVE